MRRQRNIFQRKEQGRAPKELSEVDIGNIPDKEFKAVTVNILRELGRRLYEPSGKFTKESEDVKKNQVELNNTITEIKIILEEINGLPWGLSSKEYTCQCRRCGFSPWVRKNPWRRKWQPTPVFLSGKFHGERSLMGYSPLGDIKLRYDLVTKQQRRNQQEIRYKGADQWAGRQSSGDKWNWIENKEINT